MKKCLIKQESGLLQLLLAFLYSRHAKDFHEDRNIIVPSKEPLINSTDVILLTEGCERSGEGQNPVIFSFLWTPAYAGVTKNKLIRGSLIIEPW